MIAIRSEAMSKIPEFCDDCVWMFTRPHPHKGWTDGCELMNHCIDDDQPEEWIYDGNSRPKACPLINVDETKEGLEPKTGINLDKEIALYKQKIDFYKDYPVTNDIMVRELEFFLVLLEQLKNERKKGEWHNLIENPNDTPTKTRWYCCKKKSSDDLVMIFGYEEVTSLNFDAWIEIYYPLWK